MRTIKCDMIFPKWLIFSILFVCFVFPCRANDPVQTTQTNGMDIYLLIGQSNMAGRGVVTDTTSVDGIYSLNKMNEWVPARDPLHFDKKFAGVGPGLSFAKEIKKLYPDRIIGLVPCAVGGTAISKWMPGAYDEATKTHPYDDAMSRLKIALEKGELKGILWHQGEGDCSNDNYKLYEARFASLLNNISKEVGVEIKNIPVVIGELGQFLLTRNPVNDTEKMNEVLVRIGSEHQNIICVSTEGLVHKGDNLHFDTPSAQELGRRYARAYIDICEKLNSH